jgi:hypothetical protein
MPDLDAATLVDLLEPVILELEAARYELEIVRRRLDATAWSAGVYRQGAIVLHFMGQTFEATADTASEPGTDLSWKRLGLGGLRYRGHHVEGIDYEVGDLVTKKGSMMIETGQGLAWLALRGRPGMAGAPGEAGKPGAAGAPGAAGKAGADGAMVARFEIERGLLFAVWTDGRRELMTVSAIDGAPGGAA